MVMIKLKICPFGTLLFPSAQFYSIMMHCSVAGGWLFVLNYFYSGFSLIPIILNTIQLVLVECCNKFLFCVLE